LIHAATMVTAGVYLVTLHMGDEQRVMKMVRLP